MLNQVRNFAHTMNNPITRKAFFLRNFAPKRYSEFRDLMYTLNTQFHLGVINEAEMDSALLSFWLSVLSNTHNTHNDSHLSTQHPLHWV